MAVDAAMFVLVAIVEDIGDVVVSAPVEGADEFTQVPEALVTYPDGQLETQRLWK